MIDINELRPEYWSASCGDVASLVDENIKLRAKVAEMENQVPIAHVWRCDNGHIHGSCEQTLPMGAKLYALPGAQAQPAQKAVAYLDLGVGGYMDIGTDLTDEQLASLPKGRHMLGIVGTYGVDGYVSAQPAPSLASDDVSFISEGKTQPAQSVKDDIIDDLQSQFDTEGITEHDSGDALIRLSDAIAAVEDNFAQPTPSSPEGWKEGVEAVAAMLQKKADDYAEEYGYGDMGVLSFGEGVIELLDRFEAVEKEREELRTKISDLMINVAFLDNLKKSYEELIEELQDGRDELRAKIEEMERQEPVAKVRVHQTGGNAGLAWSVAPLNDFDSLPLMRDGDRLYVLPGAKGEEK